MQGVIVAKTRDSQTFPCHKKSFHYNLAFIFGGHLFLNYTDDQKLLQLKKMNISENSPSFKITYYSQSQSQL